MILAPAVESRRLVDQRYSLDLPGPFPSLAISSHMRNFDPAVLIQNLRILRLVQLSATIANIYDHLILFDQEVELIWKRPGIIAKIYFLLTRYCGDCLIITITILLFTKANTDVVSHSRLMLQMWATAIPAWVVQVIMQFRVYAMYNREKWVLAFTCTCFIIQMAITSYLFALYEYVPVISLKFGPWTTCAATQMQANAAGTWISTMAFEGILFFLALYKTVIHLLRLNHPWTRSGATEVLLRDNILYFLIIFSIYCLMVIAWFAFPIMWTEILSSLSFTATCTLGCRLILNIREVSYRHEECVNTQEIDFQLKELVDGAQRGVVSSGVDPADSLAPGRRDDSGDQAIEEVSRQEVA
ncbi:hypothetical protein JAAARDRAFT_319207 [Jaapia argillacea MUCL 33604]|uniref:DUF6533 domain-containing protein n=1 Tax=Jaapia argillacea MUCL 33604 TaxID=933084 RepID=A0A067Q0B9_9AGAM|nr:hypothetical protein JAAARDRAFT_319207 [Jaapia argillacea MUCL 33604]